MELEQALAKITELEAQIATQNEALAEVNTDRETIKADKEALEAQVNELVEKVKTFEKSMLVESRVKQLSDAGISLPTDAEELERKQEFWAAMSEELFTEYVSDLAAVAKKVPERKAEASASFLQLPKISVDTSSNNGAVSAETLRTKMRNLSRNETAE